MKIYLLRTNAYNAVVITDGKTAKIFDGAPTGYFAGVDLYAPDAEAKLRKRYADAELNGTIENDYYSIYSDCEVPASEIAAELENLEPIYERNR